MALQVYSSVPRTSLVAPQGIASSKYGTVVCVAAGDYSLPTKRRKRTLSVGLCVKSSLDAAEAVAVVGRVTEVTKDTFWPIVKDAGDKPVVLDMYTQWCGPCKAMAPKYQKLSEKYDDVVFLKLDCNNDNRPLVKELGLKVVPTFKILKNSEIVNVVTGAKLDDLVLAIENARST